MGGKLRNDNRGVSLVEVLVVVAIIVVVGAVGILGINSMSGKPAQKCSQQIIYSLEKHRTSTMGKVSSQYVLTVDDEGKIIAEEYLSNEETMPSDPTTVHKLSDKRTKVTYVCNGTMKNIADAPLTLQFDRASGGFKQQADGSYCTQIIVERGGRSYPITLVPLTGKVYATNGF